MPGILSTRRNVLNPLRFLQFSHAVDARVDACSSAAYPTKCDIASQQLCAA